MIGKTGYDFVCVREDSYMSACAIFGRPTFGFAAGRRHGGSSRARLWTVFRSDRKNQIPPSARGGMPKIAGGGRGSATKIAAKVVTVYDIFKINNIDVYFL